MPFTRKKGRKSSTELRHAARRTMYRINRLKYLKEAQIRIPKKKKKEEKTIRAYQQEAEEKFETNKGVANTYTDKEKQEEVLREANEKYKKKLKFVTSKMEHKSIKRARGKRTRKKEKAR
jgi:hypothetical protein